MVLYVNKCRGQFFPEFFFLALQIFLVAFAKGKKGQITINVPLFKKLRDIIFFLRDNHFMSHFKGHFEGAKTFLTP